MIQIWLNRTFSSLSRLAPAKSRNQPIVSTLFSSAAAASSLNASKVNYSYSSQNKSNNHRSPTGSSPSPNNTLNGRKLNKNNELHQQPSRSQVMQRRKQKKSSENNEKESHRIKLISRCSENIEKKDYLAAAEDIYDMLDDLEEQKADESALPLLELQTNLFLHSREYLSAYLVRSNVLKYIEQAPNQFTKGQIDEATIKYFQQLVFTHTLQAEMDLEIIYKNSYRKMSTNHQATFDLAMAISHFISPDKEASEKGVNFTLDCLNKATSLRTSSSAICNLAIFQCGEKQENLKAFMEEVLLHESQVRESTAKLIKNLVEKIKKNRMIDVKELNNPFVNLLVSLNLNSKGISIYTLSDIIQNKSTLKECSQFALKALLFIVRQYNVFNISTDRSLRIKLMHTAYELGTHQKQHISEINFLYASLFADLKKPEEAKKLLAKNIEDTSKPQYDSIRYESHLLMALLDFENKYAHKKKAQEMITKENLQYWATKLSVYEIDHLYMMDVQDLSLIDKDEMEAMQAMENPQFYDNEDNDDDDENNSSEEESSDSEDDEDNDDEDESEEDFQKRLGQMSASQKLEFMQEEIEKLKKKYRQL